MHKSYSFQGWWLAREPSPHAHQAKLSYIHILLHLNQPSVCNHLLHSYRLCPKETQCPKHHKFSDCCEEPDSLYALYYFLLLQCPDLKATIHMEPYNNCSTQQCYTLPDFCNSISGGSLCFHKTLVCCARIFHASTITAGRPLPGPIFSLLELFSTSAACLKFSSISLTLRSSWRICRASWTVYKYQSFSSYLCRTILCDF